MTRSPLEPRPSDPAQEAKIQALYDVAFNDISGELWRENDWNLKQPKVKELSKQGKENAGLLSFINDNHDEIRTLTTEAPLTLVNSLIPTRWGEDNPKLWSHRTEFHRQREAKEGITLDDFRLLHDLGIESNRQKYVKERVIPDAEHAARAYSIIDGILGATAGTFASLALASERIGLLKGGRGGLIGLGIVALSAYGGSKLGESNGKELIFSEYEDLQKRVDKLKTSL